MGDGGGGGGVSGGAGWVVPAGAAVQLVMSDRDMARAVDGEQIAISGSAPLRYPLLIWSLARCRRREGVSFGKDHVARIKEYYRGLIQEE